MKLLPEASTPPAFAEDVREGYPPPNRFVVGLAVKRTPVGDDEEDEARPTNRDRPSQSLRFPRDDFRAKPRGTDAPRFSPRRSASAFAATRAISHPNIGDAVGGENYRSYPAATAYRSRDALAAALSDARGEREIRLSSGGLAPILLGLEPLARKRFDFAPLYARRPDPPHARARSPKETVFTSARPLSLSLIAISRDVFEDNDDRPALSFQRVSRSRARARERFAPAGSGSPSSPRSRGRNSAGPTRVARAPARDQLPSDPRLPRYISRAHTVAVIAPLLSLSSVAPNEGVWPFLLAGFS